MYFFGVQISERAWKSAPFNIEHPKGCMFLIPQPTFKKKLQILHINTAKILKHEYTFFFFFYLWWIDDSSWSHGYAGVCNVFLIRVCLCVCVWPTPPTRQGTFPHSASAMKIRCFLTSLDPEDPFPRCISPSLHRTTQREWEHEESKSKWGETILSALPLHMEMIYWGLGCL